MARTQLPGMSLDASGTFGKTITFSRWKGRSYIRRRVIPANPKTGLQVAFRAMMKFLAQQWAMLGPSDQATWNTLAAAAAYSPFNAYTSVNQKRYAVGASPTVAYPAAEAGTAAVVTSTTGTGGVRTASIDTVLAAAADNNGYILRRATVTPVPLTQDNIIAVVQAGGGLTDTYIDSPLVPDTYYYRATAFTLDGVLGTAGTTSLGVTVT